MKINKKIRFLTLLSALLMLLTSCGGGGQPSDTDNESTGPEPGGESTADDGGDIKIVDNGASDYIFIRSDTSPSEVTDAMLEISRAINQKYGITLGVKTDWAKGLSPTDVIENDEKEIIIGDCNRKEAKDVLATLGENEYAVRAVGNKLVIIGYNDYITVQAAKAFISGYLTESGTTLSLPRDLSVTGEASIQKIALTEGADIRIMTFNILGSGNDYAARKVYEIQAILDYLPDIIGFQEANKDTHSGTLLNTAIREYYSINAKTHSNSTTANYTPILYRTDKFNLIEGGVEWLRSRYTSTNTKSLSWAVFEVKETGKRFIVANMHGSLWANTYTLPAGETHESMAAKSVGWRVDNVNQMLDKVGEMKAKYGELPVVLTGDFNFNSTTDAYAAMIGGGMTSAQESATVSSTKGINSTHSTVGAAPAEGRNIDHVFHTAQGFSALKFVISTRPDDLKASDHCPVYADLKFN